MSNTINIMTQAFYGNKMVTEIDKNSVDKFILGYTNNNIETDKKIDRTIIKVPNTDNIVIIYNKYQEEKKLNQKEEVFRTENYVIKPLAIIPEIKLELYSRCIVCRMNENGELESLHDNDYDKFIKYLAD